jgi:hypothetical protein
MKNEVVKCALCSGSTEGGLRFCSSCVQRAQESLDRNPSSDSDAAIDVACNYLRWLYVGNSSEEVPNAVELVLLAVTASHDLRRARNKILELQQGVGGVRFADEELASLVKP